MISSLVPIQVAWNQSLSTALDQSRSKTMAVLVKITDEARAFPWMKITFSIISIAIGVSIYYLLPLSLLSLNLSLFISIFFCILIGMLFGLILLSLNLQFSISRLIIYVTLFWESGPIKSLVEKNMIGHVMRNRRTALMYSVSIAIIIFIFISYELETVTIEYEQLSIKGCWVGLDSNYPDRIPISTIESLMNSEDLAPLIASWSWVTQDMEDLAESLGYDSLTLSHKGKLYEYNPLVYGVSPNLYDNTLNKFLIVADEDQDTGLSLSEQLYTPRGMQSIIIGKAYADFLNIDFDDDPSVVLLLKKGDEVKTVELRVMAILKSSPCFYISDKPSEERQDLVMSIPTFLEILGSDGSSYSEMELPFSRLKIVTVDTEDETLDKIVEKLYEYSSIYSYSVWDYREYKEEIRQNQSILNIIFVGVAAMTMFLCLFSLVSSMTANMLEQTKEIAVLRSLGFSRPQMIRVYIYESYTLVLSSCICGMFTGGIIGYTMTVQRVLFTNLPLTFSFPTDIFICCFVVSILCALFSTFFPAYSLMKNSISALTKMV